MASVAKVGISEHERAYIGAINKRIRERMTEIKKLTILMEADIRMVESKGCVPYGIRTDRETPEDTEE
jgi:hypothetical protein